MSNYKLKVMEEKAVIKWISAYTIIEMIASLRKGHFLVKTN